MSGISGKAVASHTLLVRKDGQNLAVTPAQFRLLRRAMTSAVGSCHVRGAEVRTARACGLFGTLTDDGAFGSRGTNGDGERYTFTLFGRIEIPQ